MKLDLKNTYYYICIKEDNIQKTAFCIYYRYFEYQVLFFGLTNTLVTFQLYINYTIVGLLNDFIIVYLDNILIYSKEDKDYKEYIRRVLKQLYKYKLYIKRSKYKFSINKIKFLRFIITTKEVITNPIRVKSIA